MRHQLLASLLATAMLTVPAVSGAHDAPVTKSGPATKEELLSPPAGARHYTISSTAGKHGDV